MLVFFKYAKKNLKKPIKLRNYQKKKRCSKIVYLKYT